jgi:hypothetical protein
MLASVQLEEIPERITLVAEESGMYYEDRELAVED